MRYFKNLKFRLLFTLGAILFFLFYTFGYSVIHTLKTTYIQSIESSLFTVLKDIKHDYHEAPDKEINFEETTKEFDIPLLYAQVVAYDSLSNAPKILQRSQDLESERIIIEPKIIQEIFENPNKIVFSTMHNPKLTQRKLYVGTLFLAQTEFQMLFLQCAIPYDLQTQHVDEMVVTLWVGLLTLLGIILILAYLLLSKSLKTVQKVTNAAKAITAQDSHATIPQTDIAYEIDDLIKTFNTLLFELQHAYAQVKQFGQNASHELKTPLTIIQGEVEVGLRKERSKEEYQEILRHVLSEVGTLHEVIEKILFLSSNTKNELKTHFEEVYLDEILLGVLEEKALPCKNRQIDLHVKTVEAISVQGNGALLKIALLNLLDNAIKYSPASSRIDISLTAHELCIHDQGFGIKKEELAHVFEQFYRGAKSKHLAHGSGLGLAIVKTIVDLHDFTITLSSDEKGGTRVFITF